MWAYESVFYQIYPLGFCGAPFENDGVEVNRIQKVIEWIPHIKKLGANAIYFSPVFESDTHGYNTRDYTKIDKRLGTNAEAKLSEDGVEAVNQDMEATVEELIRQFEDTLSEEGYHGLHVTQEVVTDNALYYTVKLSVLETEASGYEHNQFYTIAKQTGNVVTLADLFAEGSDYISAISENIKTQMKEQMAADEGVIYFLDNDDMPEFNFQGITEQTNFYFNERGELVIAFDEYEVAPGSMGAPEFVIPQEVTAALLK